MASLTSKTRSIRKRKKARAGAQRKKKLESGGTTPKFSVHTGDKKTASSAS